MSTVVVLNVLGNSPIRTEKQKRGATKKDREMNAPRVPEELQLKVLREVAVLLSAIKTIAAAPSLELKVSWQHWLIPVRPLLVPDFAIN